MSTLFACSRCYSRHPFEELSSGQQLCKTCRTTYPIVKCTYCRTEFQQTSKSTTNPTCRKCENNVKAFGKPQSCVYCNIIAAFIGNKCQRCTNSEKKFGLPVSCEQCKMQCAFDRGEEDKKVDGKLLCWLCTLSYKRALAKTRSSDKQQHQQHHQRERQKRKHLPTATALTLPLDKRPHRPDVTKLSKPTIEDSSPVEKKGKESNVLEDNQTKVIQLREQIAGLNRQVQIKDRELMAKDRQITDLRAANFNTEAELRAKLKDAQRDYEAKVENMTQKLKSLQKELAVKNKQNLKQQKSSLTIVGRPNESKDDSGGSEKSGGESGGEDEED